MATQIVPTPDIRDHKPSQAERDAAFLEESMEFARERFAAMTPAERIEAAARLKASNLGAQR
jgi:hypothetical protein